MHKPFRILLGICLLTGLINAQAQTPGPRVRADVVAFEDETLQLRAEEGSLLRVKLAPGARIMLESRVDLSAVTPGVFVGTTSSPQADGSLRAVQIRIFPEALRGTGEGHRIMSGSAGNTMTNATVATVGKPVPPANTMTNATVSKLSDAGTLRSMTLSFKDGEKQVSIPPEVVVIKAEMAERKQLVPGAHIVLSISTQPDGSLSTDRITVGKAGSTPM